MLPRALFSDSFSTNAFGSKLIDVFILTSSLIIATYIYGVTLSREYLMALLVVLVSYSYVAEGLNLYRSWRAGKLREMVLTAWLSLLLSFSGLFVFFFAFKVSEQLSRITITLWFVLAFTLLFVWRVSLRSYKKNRRKLGLSSKKVAIIGATPLGIKIMQQIKLHDELGYDNVGFFEDRAPDRLTGLKPNDIVGSIDTAVNKARAGEIDVLFIALPIAAEKRIAEILSYLGDTTVDVHLVPDFLLSNLMHSRIDHVGEIDTLSVFESPYLGIRRLIKRSEDVIIGSLILFTILPVLMLIAIVIKLTSKGPVLFKQDRYGLSGQKIKVWKFRSMSVMENSDKVIQATKNDPRITPFGGFLRRTSLDELPQFFNVLSGSMSIVGPRPHAVSHNEEYRKKVEFYMLRHKVKPGITGWAQINGWRGETDTLEKMEKRVEFDLQYIKNWSVWLDIKIIILTVFKGFVSKNAY
ncbi:undecaprenyl-phosphate glucose phosphotransferase [Colwellia sp. TT2012]|uniref:undecaprenyl-phosphate glucose phosphotransferase n=1 Tax=Colwellia sp. TT2012 TaxID=1720342 RepID=UPI00070E27BF|nr:undecaprenyl-phosphate glucose phosphotransferase [Colwellia sp. TT2012]